MRKLFLLWTVAAFTLSLLSCEGGGNFLDDPRPVADPFFVVLDDTVEVEAASFFAGEAITATLGLRSNISWDGALADTSVHWVSLKQQNDINLSGLTKEYSIPVIFFDNSDNSAREVIVKFSSRAGSGKTLLRQKAFIPVLKVEGQALPDTIPAKGGKYELQIVCNTFWKADLPLGASAAVELSDSSGFRTRKLGITVEENTDPDLEASSKIKLSADGCADININIIQNKATL